MSGPYYIAVLADGDDTTWAANAFLIPLSKEQMQEVIDGNDKLMRGLKADGHPTYDAKAMFDCLRQIDRSLGVDAFGGAASSMADLIRGELSAFGFLGMSERKDTP
jgi:hypothetical protein